MSYIPSLTPTFEAALRDRRSRDVRARHAAALRLASAPEGREDEAREALRPLLDDPVAAIREAALASAATLRDRDALPVILSRFEDGEPAVRQLAVIAAGRIGGPEAVEPLRAALRDERPEVRFQAAVSFAELCPDEALDEVSPLLGDADAEVRANAAAALGALGEPDARDRLAPLLGDDAPSVRREAALALAKLGDARAARVLVECLDDPERAIEAALALGELGADHAREPLAERAAGLFTGLHLKAAAGAALARLGDARGTDALRSVLRAFRHDGRSFAAELVGELGLVALADELARLVHRPRGADPVVVAKALAELAPESAVAARALERVAGGRDRAAADVARAALSIAEPAT